MSSVTFEAMRAMMLSFFRGLSPKLSFGWIVGMAELVSGEMRAK
jgi:thiamine transporter ThiT